MATLNILMVQMSDNFYRCFHQPARVMKEGSVPWIIRKEINGWRLTRKDILDLKLMKPKDHFLYPFFVAMYPKK